MSECMVGWAHIPFGKRDDDVESMIGQVAMAALADAGLEAKDVDAIVVGHFNGGFVRQDFPAALVMQADPAFRFKPATRVENACATGSTAIHVGLNTIRAKKARVVLVVGAEKMTALPTKEVGDVLLKCSYVNEEAEIDAGFAGVFGQVTARYFQKYGDQSDVLARIAAKNHKNGVDNPYAHMQKDFGFDFCNTVSDKNPLVAGPLRRTDCSLVSDGAAAVVLADTETALKLSKAVVFRSAEHVTDYLPVSKREFLDLEGPALAWQKALANAGVELLDLDVVESHDCFTTAELMEYEAMGLTPKGRGRLAIDEGWTFKDGKLPVNPSGGLKAKGHPIGATGVSMHAMIAMQMRGEAMGMQIPGAKLGGVFNMGGTAVANFVSILEPLR